MLIQVRNSVMGFFKIIILLLISFAGFAALAGRTRVEVPNNFINAFEGTRNDMFGIASCIYNVSANARCRSTARSSLTPDTGGLELCGLQ